LNKVRLRRSLALVIARLLSCDDVAVTEARAWVVIAHVSTLDPALFSASLMEVIKSSRRVRASFLCTAAFAAAFFAAAWASFSFSLLIGGGGFAPLLPAVALPGYEEGE
jgi:hypothetical protein